jgi:hypothetical protein
VVDGGFGAGDADIDVLMVRCVESILPCDSRTGIGSIRTNNSTSTTMRDISDVDISDKDIDTKVWLRRRDTRSSSGGRGKVDSGFTPASAS